MDSSISSSSIGGWDGVWISAANLVGFNLLWLTSEWTESGEVGKESVSVEAKVEVNTSSRSSDTWINILDTDDWLLIDLAGVSVSGGSTVNGSPESISIDDLAFEASSVIWMTWTPSRIVDVGGIDEVVIKTEIVKPLHVVAIRNFNNSTSEELTVSFSVGIGIWSKQLDASLFVVLARPGSVNWWTSGPVSSVAVIADALTCVGAWVVLDVGVG